MFKIISILLIALSVISCSKKEKLNYTKSTVNGVEVITNENRPADPNLFAEFKLEKIICGIPDENSDSSSVFSTPIGIDFDSKGNMFILDAKTQGVKKFDSSGNFSKSFCREGQGPGEVEYANNLLINNDTVVVIGNGYVKFSTEGIYLYTTPAKNTSILRINKTTENKIIGLINSFEIKENRLNSILTKNLYILDNAFNPVGNSFYEAKIIIKDLYDNQGESDLMTFYPFAASDSLLYLAVSSKKEYKIKVFTATAKHIGTINKKCLPIPYSVAEKRPILERINGDDRMAKHFPNRQNNLIKFYNQKILIDDLFLDDANNLWVSRAYKSENDSNAYYVFDVLKKGVYQNSIIFKPSIKSNNFTESNISLKFYKDKIYVIDPNNSEIHIYSYRLKSTL